MHQYTIKVQHLSFTLSSLSSLFFFPFLFYPALLSPVSPLSPRPPPPLFASQPSSPSSSQQQRHTSSSIIRKEVMSLNTKLEGSVKILDLVLERGGGG